MANQQQPPSASDDSQPLVPSVVYGDDSHGGQALTVAQPYMSPTYSRTPPVVNGGMDASWFINSLRRRWMLATFMSLLLAGAAGGLLYYLFPESDTAIGQFLVRAEQEELVYSGFDTVSSSDYDIFRATQIAQVKSYDVLQRALMDPNLRQIKVLQEEEDPTMWLEENLNVRFVGDSEILSISITLDDPGPEQLKQIVDAVCDAYKELVVDKERIERIKVLDSLKSIHGKMMEDMRDKSDEYRQIAKDLGIAEGQFDPAVRLLFEEINAKMKKKAELQDRMLAIQQQFAGWIATKDNPDVQEQQIEMQVSQNQDVMIMEQELLGLRAQRRDAEKRSRGRRTGEINRIDKDLAIAQQQLDAEKAKIRQQIKQQIANSPDIERALYTQEFQRQLQFAAGQLQLLEKGRDVEKEDGTTERERGIEELREELQAKAEGSTDLIIRQRELDELKAVASDLSHRIQSWEIERDAPGRITRYGTTYVTPGINRLQRYAITAIGSIATLLLSCVAIAYMEFLNRRLNGPEQLDEGLGIRVVGTLPALNAKRMMNPKHPLVAQLTESIDSVRTALMHDSTSKPRQVVLVTSPSAMEGRTTVASQLAASLARAGRRTLLIDGDLRRPALHTLFDVPLEDGLCEVLRAETEVTDVVRPTHAEGLWLMTAGYCDADAVHAMATDQIQPIFEKLRAEYDFVIIDGAPVLGLSDPLMMGQHCDGVLMSVLRDHTSVPSIYKATELLRDVGVRLIGAVVNGVGEKADRRVTHLQIASPKAARKQLESQAEEVAVATETAPKDDLENFDFSDLSDDD